MAKSALIAKLEALPKGKHGKSFMERLTPKQRQDFTDSIAWFKEQTKPPTMQIFAKAVSDIVGMEVSKYTLARYLTDGEYLGKQKAR